MTKNVRSSKFCSSLRPGAVAVPNAGATVPALLTPRPSGHAVKTPHRLRGRRRVGLELGCAPLTPGFRSGDPASAPSAQGKLLPVSRFLPPSPFLVPQIMLMCKIEYWGFPESHGFSSYETMWATTSQGKIRFIFNYFSVLKN